MDWQRIFGEAWRQCPAIAILGTVIVTGAFGYWVFGGAYRDMKEDRDRYRAIAFEEVGILEKHTQSSLAPTPEEADSARHERWQERRAQRERDRASLPAPAPSPTVNAVSAPEVATIRRKLATVQAQSKQ